ncbi:MAG: hypothetical protein DMG81_05030 [Acidobacteria bacterium]|nr:MAG: hypothetical protein DMG81_05030 [Acidobacteriota bacterium]
MFSKMPDQRKRRGVRAILTAAFLVGWLDAACGQQPTIDIPQTIPGAQTVTAQPTGFVFSQFAPITRAGDLLSTALPQEPPLEVPEGSRLTKPKDALAAGDWLLYPTLRVFTLYSDNLFLNPVAPISAAGLGIAPALVAEWTNGIHTTTLYGRAERQFFPSEQEINTFDRQAGFIQKYSPLPDLIFRTQADYTHNTISPSLVSGIPGPVASPQTAVLPNGNTVLPNGTIVNPQGQVVGQSNPALFIGSTAIVNPYDQFTATASVDKYFNRGIVSLTGAISRTDYDNPTLTTPDFTVSSFSGRGAFWLDSVFYLYSDGVFAAHTDPVTNATLFRTVGGIGFRPDRAFSSAVYYGRQGSDTQGSGTAGGDVFGARLSYMPMRNWTVSLAVDETINISSQTTPSNLALTIPVQSPLLVPLNTSVRITSTALQTDYIISPRWNTTAVLDYVRYDYIDSPRVDNVWVASAVLRYIMRKDLTLSWQYQYSDISSNAPLVSATRNYVSMSALFKF